MTLDLPLINPIRSNPFQFVEWTHFFVGDGWRGGYPWKKSGHLRGALRC